MKGETTAWAIINSSGNPFLHSIRKTKREVVKYTVEWCGSAAVWQRISRNAQYTIEKVKILRAGKAA